MIREPISREAKEKIQQLYHKGARRTREMQRHLDIPDTESLRRSKLPHPSDIRNIIYAKKAGTLASPYDQVNLQMFVDDWKKSYPEDFIFYRVIWLCFMEYAV